MVGQLRSAIPNFGGTIPNQDRIDDPATPLSLMGGILLERVVNE